MKRQILMILVVIFVLAGPLAAQSDDGPTLEETIAWINSKLDDPAHHPERFYSEFNGHWVGMTYSIRMIDRRHGRIIVHKRITDDGTYTRQQNFRLYLADIKSVYYDSKRDRVSLNLNLTGDKNIEWVHQDDTESPNWGGRIRYTKSVHIEVVPDEMGERIKDAFRHAVEIAPPSLNDDAGEIF